MGSPSGQYSKLWLCKEAETSPGVFPSAFATSNLIGLKLYQETFQSRPRKTPIRYQENRGGVSFDHADFVPGPQDVPSTLRFALRYSGVHAVMLGHALGSLTTTSLGGTPNAIWRHRADTSSGRYNSLSFLYHRPINDAGTLFSETRVIGAKVGRMRLSQSVGQPFVMCEMDLACQEARIETAVTALGNLPSESTVGIYPSEALWQMQHFKDYATNRFFEFRRRNGSVVALNLEEWTLELNNFPSQLGILSPANRLSNAARGQIREVTGSFVIEQDSSLDDIEAAYGLTASSAAEDFYLKWRFEDPASPQNSGDPTHDAEVIVSQCYVSSPERGGEGTGPQRRRYEFAAHAKGPLASWNTDYPLQIDIANNTQKPTGAAPTNYGTYVTGAGGF